jgi:hypothetical protein
VLARFLQIRAVERAVHGNLPLVAAAEGADVAVYPRAETAGFSDPAYCASHSLSIEGELMDRINLFFKVEIEHDEDERIERLANEICRRLAKIYGVRSVEFTSFTRVEE